MILVCPIHSVEEVHGVLLSGPGAWPEYAFTCERTDGHPGGGPFSWTYSPEPESQGVSGLAAELGLDVELPAVLAQFSGMWVEYGVIEHAYATARSDDFARLVDQYGHTAIKAKRYTASAFLAKTLGDMSRHSIVAFHAGPATGRWSYNSQISWWSLYPTPDWGNRVSWESTGQDMSYVKGSTE